MSRRGCKTMWHNKEPHKTNRMEKNTKKNVFSAATAFAVVLAVASFYFLFVNPNGYWQTKMREADRKEYMEMRMRQKSGATHDKKCPKLDKSAEKEFEAWRAKKRARWIPLF